MAARAANANQQTFVTQPQVAHPAQAASMCDYCHQKARFANHLYCSKTCAAQSATLCLQCKQKPKYQNFDYCGKNCAGAASGNAPATTSNPNRNTNNQHGAKAHNSNPTGTQTSGNRSAGTAASQKGNPNTNAKGTNAGSGGVAGGNGVNPVQLAQLIGQHVQLPAGVQALIGAAAAAQATSQGQVTNNGLGLIGVPAPNISGTASAVGGTAVYVPSANTLPTAPNGQAQQSAPVAIDAKCLIPGCGKHVHIDASGNKASNYCSLWHREEAVTSGLVPPCIMCLKSPQGDKDHFCSRACREDALNKPVDPGTANATGAAPGLLFSANPNVASGTFGGGAYAPAAQTNQVAFTVST